MRTRLMAAIESLRNLKRSPDSCFDLIILLAVEKFDSSTKREWDIELSKTHDFPSLDDLLKFLQTYARVGTTTDGKQTSDTRKSFRSVSHLGVVQNISCVLCKGEHFLYQCKAFRSLSVPDRLKTVKHHKRCINCLSPNHVIAKYNNSKRCFKCNGLHHTLLHKDSTIIPAVNSVPEAAKPVVIETSSHLMSRTGGHDQVLLPTARIKIYSSKGRSAIIRAIIDPGSQATLLSENIVQLLHLPRASLATHVTSVGHMHIKSNAVSCIGIGAVDSSVPFVPANTIIVSELTRYAPGQFGKQPAYPHLNHLSLADSPMSSEPFDAILGSNVCSMLLKPGMVQKSINEPDAINSIFGWIVFGNIKTPTFPFEISVNHLTLTPLRDEIQRFWEIEEVFETTDDPCRDDLCEPHFEQTHTRRPDGRYVVRLPFKENISLHLGESKQKAIKCLEHLRRKLDRNSDQSIAYDKFMHEYEQLQHMQLITEDTNRSEFCNYIPHHGVYKRTADPQSLRVVFNASSSTASGKSLNDCLMAGPKLQIDLPAIILRWRLFEYVLVADISKMFRQILVDDRDTDYQRILWRSSTSATISEFRLTTVTYGTTCASFLALRVIEQLARDEGAHFPLALPVIRNQRFVDDFLFGADSITQLLSIRDQLVALLRKGGFTLSKWSGNHHDLLRDIGSNARKIDFDNDLLPDQAVKVLGLMWNPVTDAFGFSVSISSDIPSTRRMILSTIAKLYDPLGWITPIIIRTKILIQRLWSAHIGWDEPIPGNLYSEWNVLYTQLPTLQRISINRWTHYNPGDAELHGFADASESAYAAVIYLHTTNQIITQLLIGKSRVAPIKTVSLPRLELCAAVLLARLLEYVRVSLSMSEVNCFCWSDSTIVLSWIRQSPSKWKTFVTNRVSKIQSLGNLVYWAHPRIIPPIVPRGV